MEVVLPSGYAGEGAVGGAVGGVALSQILLLLCLLLGDTERQRPLICLALDLVVLLTVDMSLTLGSVRD